MLNPMVGVASLGGLGAKTIADSMTGQNVQQLMDTIAAGGSKSATQAAPNLVQRLAQSERDPLTRLLMSFGINRGKDITSALSGLLPGAVAGAPRQ